MTELRSTHKLPSIRELEGQRLLLEGQVIDVIFFSEKTGFFVSEFKPSKSPFAEKFVTLCGYSPKGVKSKCFYKIDGVVVQHPKYKHQIKSRSIEPIQPKNTKDMIDYLSSGFIPGIGRKTAKKLIEAFGEKVIEVLDTEPARILDIRGLSGIRGKQIIDAWHTHRFSFKTLSYLMELGFGPALSMRIWETWGAKTIEKINSNPYDLYMEIPGVGFKTADTIALKLGFPPNSPFRRKAAIRYVVDRITNSYGNTFAYWNEVYSQAATEIGASADEIMQSLTEMILEGTLVKTEEGVGMPSAVFSEEGVAGHLIRLMRTGERLFEPLSDEVIETFIKKYESANKITLDPAQAEAVRLAAKSPVCVISGGPGVGKTTIIKCVISLLVEAESLKRPDILLVAPTGRAAKRMQEATGYTGRTIHRAIGMGPDGQALYRDDNPLSAKLIVVDETSMVDVYVANALLRAVAAGTRIIIVGDPDQLPSVGPGTVLGDIIESGVIPVAKLKKIFRQGEGSAITLGAHAINQGEIPQCGDRLEDELVFIDAEKYRMSNETVEKTCFRLIQDHLYPELVNRFNFHPLNDIQVLVPMKKGEVGVYEVNRMLQKICNPYAQKRNYLRLDAGQVAYPGDKIIVTRNDYNVGLFNGDVGYIQGIDDDNEKVDLIFEDGVFTVDIHIAESLIMPAYAITIHKSQGSEYPVVIIVLTIKSLTLLERQLLFTGVTRGKKKVILVGEKKAIEYAVKTYRGRQRHTRLVRLLMEKP